MIAMIEDAILNAIRGVNDGRLGYRIASVATYGGEFDDDLNQVVRSFPGVWVVFAGSGKPVPYGTSKVKWRVPVTFAVMVGARSVRSEPFSRHGLEADGTVLEVGAYRLLEDLRPLLLSADFGLEIAPFEPGAIKTLYNTRLSGLAVSIFAHEWHTAFVVGPVETDPDLLRVSLDYSVSGVPDVASDLVTLPAV